MAVNMYTVAGTWWRQQAPSQDPDGVRVAICQGQEEGLWVKLGLGFDWAGRLGWHTLELGRRTPPVPSPHPTCANPDAPF